MSRFRSPLEGARTSRPHGYTYPSQAREDTVQVRRRLELAVDDVRGVRIFPHIVLVVKLVLKYVVDHTAEKGDICSGAYAAVNVRELRRTCVAWINVDDLASTLFALIAHLKKMGWFSAALLPMMSTQSEFFMSIQLICHSASSKRFRQTGACFLIFESQELLRQDADVVIFIYRPEVYGRTENEGIAELLLETTEWAYWFGEVSVCQRVMYCLQI